MGQMVTFLSDFGLQDPYVAEVKAVLLANKPALPVVDLTHQVPAYNVAWGAFQLRRSYRFFPKGTFHLAVVDPGVGTERRNVYVKTAHYHFIGPDNGLLYWAVEDCEKRDKKRAAVFDIPVPKGTAPTFYGRDVFAPFLAALLARKAPKLKKGAALHGEAFPKVQKKEHTLQGEIIGWDYFGNLITSIPYDRHPAEARFAGLRDKIAEAPNYLSIPRGKVALIRGSHGFWEIAARTGSAADLLRVKPKDPITIFLL